MKNSNKEGIYIPVRILTAFANLTDFRDYLHKKGLDFNTTLNGPLTANEVSLLQVLSVVLLPLSAELTRIRKALESR